MKTKLFFIAMLCMMICGKTYAQKQGLTLQLQDVRNDKGDILIMINDDQSKTPVFQMVKAKKGTMQIPLPAFKGKKVQINIMHDENGNKEMDKDANGMPLEGYATLTLPNEKAKNPYVLYMTYMDEAKRGQVQMPAVQTPEKQ